MKKIISGFFPQIIPEKFSLTIVPNSSPVEILNLNFINESTISAPILEAITSLAFSIPSEVPAELLAEKIKKKYKKKIVQEPAEPAKPPVAIVEEPAEPPVSIVEEPAEPPVVIVEEPAEPPVAIVEEPADVEELVPKPTESLPEILKSSPPDTVAAVVIEEKTAIAVSSNSNSTTNNKPPVDIASSFSRNQLVEMCGAAGISRAGTKDALVERLILKGVLKKN